MDPDPGGPKTYRIHNTEINVLMSYVHYKLKLYIQYHQQVMQVCTLNIKFQLWVKNFLDDKEQNDKEKLFTSKNLLR
jgi:hypothetical protein